MADSELNVVTGAFGFSGDRIARRLLAEGKRVLTLTGKSGEGSDLRERVSIAPYHFDQPEELARSLQGARVLFNTYWVRFAHGELTYEKAVQNSKILIQAAKVAGVERIVHVSITNPSLDSPFGYFRGKAEVEQAIHNSGLSYAILRPAVLFGDQGILINNIAWFLRHFPVFAIPGSGEYGLQPVFVDDLAELAVSWAKSGENVTLDAVGPEQFTFNDLLRRIREAVGSHASLVHVPPMFAYLASSMLGRIVGDVVLTWEEVEGLMANLLISSQPPTGKMRLSEWIPQNASWLGTRYFSEIQKHFR